MTDVMVVAPHPDDETMGVGGTILRHREMGDRVAWLVVTGMTNDFGKERMSKRADEVERVAAAYGFSDQILLNLPTAQLDTVPRSEMIAALGGAIRKFAPHTLYVPFPGDVHTDHAVVFEAVAAASKWFRSPSVCRLLAYEVPSETDVGVNPVELSFRPNIFVDVAKYIERKLEILRIFDSELGPFPFPRSVEAVRSLAKVRGAASGFQAAEALMLLRERLS
jgi:LmbE family N-acetylglucosaminyl deacetylase